MRSLFDCLVNDTLHPSVYAKSALEDGFPYAQLSRIAEAESWRKEVFRPLYHIHKWWAQRLGSIFRAIIIAAANPQSAPIMDLFYQLNDLDGLVVFDPFMGSGTTIGEAIKLGCTAIGRDINPVAYNAVRAAFAKVTIPDVKRTYADIDHSVGERVRSLYALNDGSTVMYYFWVKTVTCPLCYSSVDLFSNYVFSRNAYPSRHPEAHCLCPSCGDIFDCRYNSHDEICPSCSYRFDPQTGPARRITATCSSCNATFQIVRAVQACGRPPTHRMYAKLVLTCNNQKEYRRISEEDLAAYQRAEQMLRLEDPLVAHVPIKPGNNTDQVLNYCYTHWEQFYNARQLLALSWLGKRIRDIQNPEQRLLFSVFFSGITEFNNMFCSFKGEGTGAVRPIFSHHILKPERQPLEANVWGTPKSSGSFSTLFRSRLIRALEYSKSPFELELRDGKTYKKHGCNPPILHAVDHVTSATELRPRSLYLSCGDSSKTDLPDQSVDLVITDPPFFDNVHYSELADFFYVWQLPLLGSGPNGQLTTRREAEVQDSDAVQFAKKLSAVLTECHRVLKDDGLLAFTYHHSRNEGWTSVANAVLSSGFQFTWAHPVKAEMSVAVPKRQAKDPINFDIILVCRKSESITTDPLPFDTALEIAAKRSRLQIREFHNDGQCLSSNDLRVILLSNLLVSLSAGRDAQKVTTLFKESQKQVDREVVKLTQVQ